MFSHVKISNSKIQIPIIKNNNNHLNLKTNIKTNNKINFSIFKNLKNSSSTSSFSTGINLSNSSLLKINSKFINVNNNNKLNNKINFNNNNSNSKTITNSTNTTKIISNYLKNFIFNNNQHNRFYSNYIPEHEVTEKDENIDVVEDERRELSTVFHRKAKKRIPLNAPKMWEKKNMFDVEPPIFKPDNTIMSKPDPNYLTNKRRTVAHGNRRRRATAPIKEFLEKQEQLKIDSLSPEEREKYLYEKNLKKTDYKAYVKEKEENKFLWDENTKVRFTGKITAQDYLNKKIDVGFRHDTSAEDLENVHPTVRKIFSWDNANAKELHSKAYKEFSMRFGRKDGDTGSSEVQIAVLTHKIDYLQDHISKNHKDRRAKRTLDILIHRRRKLMIYLKRKNFDIYWATVRSLDISPVI